MNRFAHSIILLALFAWFGSAEAHFSLAPKIAIEPLPLPQPETTLFRSGAISASRGEFSDYLQRLIAFDTKYQRLQPNFSAHFNLLRGVAFFHPDNVHRYIDTTVAVRANPAMYQFAVKQWIKGQIGVYARLTELFQRAKQGKLDRSPEVAATLEFYAAGAKTALLEELIVLGDMDPSVAGMRAFVGSKGPQALGLIDRGIEGDTELTPPEEQRRLKDRWRRFRHDLLQSTRPVNRCESVTTFSEPGESLMIELGRHRITFAQYRALFGLPASEKYWAGQKRGNCSRMILFYAMADFADELGILPARLQKDIRISSEIYLMGVQLAGEASMDLTDRDGSAPLSLAVARELMQHPKVIEVKDWLLAKRAPAQDGGADRFLDQELIESTEWSLERTLAPKHSIHM